MMLGPRPAVNDHVVHPVDTDRGAPSSARRIAAPDGYGRIVQRLMYEYLGTVRNIAAGRSMLDLLVYDDGIVVGRGDLKSMMLKVAGTAAFGGLGFGGASQATDEPERQRDAAAAVSDRVELLALHPDNRFIPSDAIVAVRYSHPRFPPIYRIDLDLADGRAERFDWKRIHNEPKAVAALLRHAFGERLTTERI